MIEMSRKEAIKTIHEFYYPILSRFWLDEKKDVLADALEMAIEALKERPHGEWIRHIDDLYPEESTEECSICHEEQRITGNDDNFCPNCGADMRKKEGESN